MSLSYNILKYQAPGEEAGDINEKGSLLMSALSIHLLRSVLFFQLDKQSWRCFFLVSFPELVVI